MHTTIDRDDRRHDATTTVAPRLLKQCRRQLSRRYGADEVVSALLDRFAVERLNFFDVSDAVDVTEDTMPNHSQPQTHASSSTGSSNKKSKRVEDVENKSLAQGAQIDDDAELGADNDGDMRGASQVEAESNIETATLRDKEGRLVESDDTKRASGNRSTSQFRQSDQHGNMTRPDDRRHGGQYNKH